MTYLVRIKGRDEGKKHVNVSHIFVHDIYLDNLSSRPPHAFTPFSITINTTATISSALITSITICHHHEYSPLLSPHTCITSIVYDIHSSLHRHHRAYNHRSTTPPPPHSATVPHFSHASPEHHHPLHRRVGTWHTGPERS